VLTEIAGKFIVMMRPDNHRGTEYWDG